MGYLRNPKDGLAEDREPERDGDPHRNSSTPILAPRSRIRDDAQRMPEPPRFASSVDPATDYGWLLGTVGSWFAGWGMVHVLFSWLLVGELQVGPEKLGTAQMFLTVPGLLVLPYAGVIADRRDRRDVLIRLHLFAAGLAMLLAVLVGMDVLSFPVLIVYALGMGTSHALFIPARDSLLSDVAGRDLMRAVTGLTLAHYTMQAIGSLVAGSARWVGSASALGLQSVVLLAGLIPLWRLRPAPPHRPYAAHHTTFGDIRDGFHEVWHSPALRPVVLISTTHGLLSLGPFLVAFPIMVRDVYHGGVGELGVVHMAFPAGIILGSLMLLARRSLHRKGHALLLGLVSSGSCLIVVGLGLPFWGLVLVTVAWGGCSTFFFNASRTLVQQAAPATHRARVLSLYWMGLFGTAPLGAFVSGFVVQLVGPLLCSAIVGLTLITVTAAAWFISGIRKMV